MAICNSVISQVIPDLRVRSVQVSNGGSSYTSAPTVVLAGGGGNSAAATATINADGEVNGVAVTNNGTAFTGVPTVSFNGWCREWSNCNCKHVILHRFWNNDK